MRPRPFNSFALARARWATVTALALLGSPAIALTGGAGEIVEEFTDTAFLDRLSTAIWAFNGSGRLVAGSGVGGNGSDGVFVAVGTEGVLDTSANRGVFNFSRFAVPVGTRVRFTGPNPARVRVLLRADVYGEIVVAGGDGRTGSFQGQVTIGGTAGPGGGRGGNGNPSGTSTLSPFGESGMAAPGVTRVETCFPGIVPRSGGGCGGQRRASEAGGGGGGGHAEVGGMDATGYYSGFGGLDYGTEDIAQLLAGSGGGAGGNDEDGRPFPNDDPGGAGGGGGGAISLEVGRMLSFAGVIDATGGGGGSGFRASGAGGGGSGGAIRIRTARHLSINAGSFDARGGAGGRLSAPGRQGGAGSPGRIRFECLDAYCAVDRSEVLTEPPESVGALPQGLLGRSIGASVFRDTGVSAPRYAFDGSDPATGALRTDAGVTDIVLPNGVPPGTTASILFSAAPEDAGNPGFPDLSQEVGPVTDVTRLDGLRFIRFAVRFNVGTVLPVAVVPEIDRLRIRFVCP